MFFGRTNDYVHCCCVFSACLYQAKRSAFPPRTALHASLCLCAHLARVARARQIATKVSALERRLVRADPRLLCGR
jgi:hypothetical protein